MRPYLLLTVLSLAGAPGPLLAQTGPAKTLDAPQVKPQAQPQAQTGAGTVLDRFLALPPERQEALRNQLQPIFSHNLMANARLLRLQQDCGRPLPASAAPAAQLEHDLQDPNDDTARLFGRSRQGALLAQFKGALSVPGNCNLADEETRRYDSDLAGFSDRFQRIMQDGLR